MSTITQVLSALPAAPARSQTPTAFVSSADAFIGGFALLQTQQNALTGQINTVAGEVAANAALTSTNTATVNAANAAIAAQSPIANAASAANSASIATAAALSAASVLQQDLSAFTGALHRSPNAITAQFIYDTSKDSDGGAWIDRMQDKSWANEPLNGTWLGSFVSTAVAITYANTAGIPLNGSYFQYTPDGKFYRINAAGATVEIFRGNTAKFPRLSAIVAEAGTVTIYDLTAPGRPMWMRFLGNGSVNSMAVYLGISGAITNIAMLNGQLVVGASPSSAASFIDFLRDNSFFVYSDGTYIRATNVIRDRNVGTNIFNIGGRSIAQFSINSVAMTVLPDAPVDIATGLAVPTIAIATGGGVSVLKHDGTVVNSSIATAIRAVTINSDLELCYGHFLGLYYGWRAISLAGIQSGFSGDYYTVPLADTPVSLGKSVATFIPAAPGPVNILRMNRAAPGKSLTASITNTYNTGHMIGDIRRCYLSSVTAETLSGAEKVVNGTFNTDVSGWAAARSASISWQAGRIRVTNAGGLASGIAEQAITVLPGSTQRISLDLTALSGVTSGFARVCTGSGTTGVFLINDSIYVATYTNTFTVPAGVTTVYVTLQPGQGTDGQYAEFDNISVKEAVADRSYKAAAATVYGTLTKTPVGTGSQLVAYSGFSTANYLQEPYSADLDFGTGDFSISAWVKFTSTAAGSGVIFERGTSTGGSGTNPYISVYISASGQFGVFVSDGPTYRVIVTPSAYNTGAWLKVRCSYTAGRLAILVNGVEVANVTGSPLLTVSAAASVCTIGAAFNAQAIFPGSIALLKISGTVPTAEQALFAYTQEAAMFKDGAQVALPDSGAVLDLTYDDQQDKWVAVSTANESSFTGLVRTATAAVPSGAFLKTSARSGVKLLSRTAGTDITLPAYGLREELIRRAEAAAKQSKTLTVFDFDAIAAQTDFPLPIGWRTTEVLSAGASKREGATKDWVRLYDGFREAIRFATAPGAAVWVQLTAKRE